MDISERIKTKRTELQLTQEELAKKVGVSFQAISKWENGKSLPDIEILPVLSKVLNESIDFYLFIICHTETVIIHVVATVRIELPTYFCYPILKATYE